jgi:hypothetical protein
MYVSNLGTFASADQCDAVVDKVVEHGISWEGWQCVDVSGERI